jgi:hypothetical protein
MQTSHPKNSAPTANLSALIGRFEGLTGNWSNKRAGRDVRRSEDEAALPQAG